MSNITETRRGSVAAPSSFDPTYQRAKQVLERHYKLQEGRDPQGLSIESLGRFPLREESFAALDAIRPEAEVALAELQRQARPATVEETVQHLAKLGRSFPTSGVQGDISGYGSELLDYVLNAQPTIGDLDEGRRQLVLTQKWMPAICEVIDAITAAKESREHITGQIVKIVRGRDLILKYQERLANEERDRLEREHRRKQREIAQFLPPPDINDCVNKLPL